MRAWIQEASNSLDHFDIYCLQLAESMIFPWRGVPVNDTLDIPRMEQCPTPPVYAYFWYNVCVSWYLNALENIFFFFFFFFCGK